jgi:hypothetical protein
VRGVWNGLEENSCLEGVPCLADKYADTAEFPGESVKSFDGASDPSCATLDCDEWRLGVPGKASNGTSSSFGSSSSMTTDRRRLRLCSVEFS